MKAIVFKDNKMSVVEKPVPETGEGELLIKLSLAGICNTDIELFSGYYGFTGVAGHEFAGVVEKSPPMPELEGERVVADINCGCGTCSWCLKGNQRHCPSRKVIGIAGRDGAFAEYIKVPVQNVRPVDEAISTAEAVFVEPLAAALEIGQQIHITGDLRMMILGDGKLGLLIAIALRHYNPNLLLVGKHAENLAIARKQGVNTLHIHSPAELTESLPAKLGLFDLVVEATGKADGINHALNFTRPEGTIVVKTTSHHPAQIDLARIVVDEINIVGSRCGDFDLALFFLKNGLVDVKPLIEAVYPFSEFAKAFHHARRPGAGKILISFD
ncbi:MAG: dehydrogenase [Peptococcaceae bacterium]|nr:MAG: dehydrogenase [Peptococcaceae bacterium]